MTPRTPIDLASHINETQGTDQDARFPVTLEPIYQQLNGSHVEVPGRRAVVRQDTGRVLSVVSDRYQLVPHVRILGAAYLAAQLPSHPLRQLGGLAHCKSAAPR